MLGAIIGDIVGSVYEWHNIKIKEFPFFRDDCHFTDDIRNAISLGGDSDTLAAITGGIAEAAYGVPPWIKDKAWRYLDGPLKDVCRRWRKFIRKT